MLRRSPSGRPAVTAAVLCTALAVAAPLTGVLAPPTAGAAGPPAVAAPGMPPQQAVAFRHGRGLTAPVREVLAAAPAKGPVRIATVVTDALGRPSVRVVTARDRAAAADVVLAARADRRTLALAVDRPARALGTLPPSNDDHRDVQWGMDRLAAEDAQALTRAAGQIVAVVDTGVDATHGDLAGQVLNGYDFTGANPQTSIGTGRSDPHGHGTHVAGVIAAKSGDAFGVAGLADGVRILPVRVLGANGQGSMASVAAGVYAAANAGAAVINLSLGSESPDDVSAAAIEYARGKGAIVVAAAGNFREACAEGETSGCGNPPVWPASYPGVLGVAATKVGDTSAEFSETGSAVDLAAPGDMILSAYPGGAWVYMSGTSQAAPFVSAAAAMVCARYATITPTAVADLLQSTAEDLGPAGRDDEFGAGMVAPLAALQATPPTGGTGCLRPKAATRTTVTLSSTRVVTGSNVRATATVRRTADNVGTPGNVTFCFIPLGRTTGPCSTVAANSSGVASVVWRPAVGTVVAATFTGTASATSSGVRTSLGVVPRVTLVGGRRTLSVTVGPAQGQRVTVQRQRGTAWATVASRTAATTPWRLTKLTAGRYRVVVATSKQVQGVTTGSVRVS